MNNVVRFLGISCEFLYEISEKNGCCWNWKLDPYRCPETEDIPLRIDLTGNEIEKTAFTEEGGLVYMEEVGFFQHQVFRTQDGRLIWRYVRIHSGIPYLSFSVNKQWSRISLLEDHTQSGGSLAFEYLGHIMPGVLLKYNILTFHGVLMEYQGMGIIISAPSGTGKTTHARLWRDIKNALIINGDRAVCRRENGRWIGYGLPWSGTSGEQINRSVPMKALVVLERGEENEAHHVSDMEAFGKAFPHLLYTKWDKSMADKALDGIDSFLKDIPVIRLSCRPDPEAVEVLDRALEEVSCR